MLQLTESFFNPSIQLRFNKVYKAFSRRVPVVVVKFSPKQFTPPGVEPSVRNKLGSLVQKLAAVYDKSDRVRKTSRYHIDHKPPTLAIYSAKLDNVGAIAADDDDDDDDDGRAAAPASRAFAESEFVGIRRVYQVGDVICSVTYQQQNKKMVYFWFARVRLAFLQGEEQVELGWYDVDDAGVVNEQPGYDHAGDDEDDAENKEDDRTYQIIQSENTWCHVAATKSVPELSGTERLTVAAELYQVFSPWVEPLHSKQAFESSAKRRANKNIHAQEQIEMAEGGSTSKI